MRVADLIAALQDADPDADVRVVEQPNYPLVADINEERWDGPLEIRGATVYIHLHGAYDYYAPPADEEEVS